MTLLSKNFFSFRRSLGMRQTGPALSFLLFVRLWEERSCLPPPPAAPPAHRWKPHVTQHTIHWESRGFHPGARHQGNEHEQSDDFWPVEVSTLVPGTRDTNMTKWMTSDLQEFTVSRSRVAHTLLQRCVINAPRRTRTNSSLESQSSQLPLRKEGNPSWRSWCSGGFQGWADFHTLNVKGKDTKEELLLRHKMLGRASDAR